VNADRIRHEGPGAPTLARQRHAVFALLVLATLALGAAGCGHTPLWERVDSDWKTVSSEHFTLHTNARSATYSEVLDRLEEVHAALSVTLFEQVAVPGVEALLLSGEDYLRLLGDSTGSIFASGEGLEDGLLVIRDVGDHEYLEKIAAHEIVHRFIAAQYPLMPVWLDEGIASYLETIRVRSHEVIIGIQEPRATRDLGIGALQSLQGLAHARREQFHKQEHRRDNYHTAQAFVHWMLHARGGHRASASWTKLVGVYGPDGNRDETPDDVMARLFPELTWPEIQASVQADADHIAQARTQNVWLSRFERPARASLRVAPADIARVKRLCHTLGGLHLPWNGTSARERPL
jgi:hypothetical protein